MLAEVGADVIKVEPPWGEAARKAGPHRPGQSNGDRGGRFAFLNTNKLGVTLNLKHPRGVELLMKMLDGADLLVENFAPGTPRAARARTRRELLKRFPKLSVISISNFGADGPDRDARLNDLTLFARGGWTYPVGEPDREPLTPPDRLPNMSAALFGAVAAMQAMLARDLTLGHGQHVDVSLLQAAALTMIYESGQAFNTPGSCGSARANASPIGPFMIVTLKCLDGYAGLQCVTDKQFESLCEMMGRPRADNRPAL